MKINMKFILLIITFSLSTMVAATAQEKPVSTHYSCTNKGCSVTCLNARNNWTTVATSANTVRVNHYSNGNIEFILKNISGGANSNEVIFIGGKHLKCKLSGVK